jgi:galactose mutarotase-like enzyme
VIEIGTDALRASVNPFGAELSSLRDAAGAELMTDADPAFWTGRAPLLFPIVGALNGNRYRLGGETYELAKHGFARRQMFEVMEQDERRALFRLRDNEETRVGYPFALTLDAAFEVVGATLRMAVTVVNDDTRAMPVSFGYHPAFAWGRSGEAIAFDKEEPSAIAVLDSDGLIAGERPSPLDGRTLRLDDALFADDALIWTSVQSERVTFDRLDIAFPGAPMLGIWTKPGARFVCVEPWWGLADPAGFDGEIWDKPGILRLEPGETRSFVMQVTLAR